MPGAASGRWLRTQKRKTNPDFTQAMVHLTNTGLLQARPCTGLGGVGDKLPI